MTATAARPRSMAFASPTPPPPPTKETSLQPAAEVALAVVSVATVAGMARLFVDGSFFWPLVGHALAAHGVAATCRRRGVSVATSAAVTGVIAVVVLSWAHLGDTLTLGVPTGRTLDAARDRLEEAWRLFDEVKAPAPVLPGFLLSAGAALWIGAWLADLAAFRLWTALEALIPSGTVFVFASLFSADNARTASAAGWLAAALAFSLLHRTARQHASPSWLGSDPYLGSASLLKVGGVLVVVTVAGAAVIGPRLPGAGDAAVVAVRDLDDGGSSRQTVSPLVEIRGRLVDQSQAELFQVRSAERAYWRLTSLDEFDGEVWSSRGSFGDADGDLDDLGPVPPGTNEVLQQISVTGLAAIWLPAAFEPRAIEPGDAEVRWEAESSTLIVSTDHPTSDGISYQVISAVPSSLEAATLAAAGGEIPDEVADRGTRLPPGFPPTVTSEAQRIVAAAGATTPYAVALALQAYFRSGAFEYSLEVPAGHSDSAIEEFLFVRRSGYCEQFAGTYAAMARAVGLPSRVAVGFTPGDAAVVDPTLFHVRGEHAHAWPEVFIAGVGWVAFEPTPGRGAPNAAYTGIEEQQDAAGPSTEATLVPTTVRSNTPATFPGESTVTTAAPTDATLPQPDGPDERRSTPFGRWFLWAVLAFLALGAAVLVGGLLVAAARGFRRWRRWSTATTPDARVRSAWADAVEAAGVVGLVPRGHETPVEFARRAGRALGDTRPTPLAWVVERADYAEVGVDDGDAEHAVELAAGIRAAMRERTSPRARLLAAADPRPPDRRTRGRRGPRPAGPRIQIRREG